MENIQACSAESLVEMMRDGVIRFRFRKADGTDRTAYGTLCPKVIDDYFTPSSKAKRETSGSNVSYFDIEKLEWRCFSPSRLIGYFPDYNL